MTLFEVFLIGIALSMDAVAVSLTNGMIYYNCHTKKLLMIPVFFGAFQAIMPVIGYFAGSMISGFVEKWAALITFLILAVIGGKMIYDSFKKEEAAVCCSLSYKLILIQAIATSIDAFAVGVSFSFAEINLLRAVIIIGVTTLLLSTAAVFAGVKFGDKIGQKARLIGGLILVIIGIKSIV